jgi:hypothetical protein
MGPPSPEGLLLALRAALYLSAVLWVLPLPEAVAFIAVYEAVFSLYLGCSFAPNHKGMPLIDGGSTMSFTARQVVTARNVSGGRWTGFILGGLNYQIEHHLFPTIPGRAWDVPGTSSGRSASITTSATAKKARFAPSGRPWAAFAVSGPTFLLPWATRHLCPGLSGPSRGRQTL